VADEKKLNFSLGVGDMISSNIVEFEIVFVIY
jgi:hypothetical protein